MSTGVNSSRKLSLLIAILLPLFLMFGSSPTVNSQKRSAIEGSPFYEFRLIAQTQRSAANQEYLRHEVSVNDAGRVAFVIGSTAEGEQIAVTNPDGVGWNAISPPVSDQPNGQEQTQYYVLGQINNDGKVIAEDYRLNSPNPTDPLDPRYPFFPYLYDERIQVWDANSSGASSLVVHTRLGMYSSYLCDIGWPARSEDGFIVYYGKPYKTRCETSEYEVYTNDARLLITPNLNETLLFPTIGPAIGRNGVVALRENANRLVRVDENGQVGPRQTFVSPAATFKI